MTHSPINVDEMLAGYMQAAVWASTDAPLDADDRETAEPEPLDDQGYTADDLDAASVEEMRADVEAFAGDPELRDVWRAYVEALDARPAMTHADSYGRTHYTPSELAGHDYWLTRNGHGCGFWDRGLGDVGHKLTEACRPYGESYLMIGDDGKLYVS